MVWLNAGLPVEQEVDEITEMPIYQIDEKSVDVSGKPVLIDTGVLFALFHPDDQPERRIYAEIFRDEQVGPLLVPSIVVVEAWGLMLSRNKQDSRPAIELLQWLNTPGTAIVVPPHRAELVETHAIVSRLSIDCVDAMMAELADNITRYCDLQPALPIATFDTEHFQRVQSGFDLHFSIYSVGLGELWEYQKPRHR